MRAIVTTMVTINLIVVMMVTMRSDQLCPSPPKQDGDPQKGRRDPGAGPGTGGPLDQGGPRVRRTRGAGMGPEPRWHDGGMLHHRSGPEHI